MRTDFCVFILSHGRPDRVHTFATLQKLGYTGRLYIVIDDEDKTADAYRATFGDRVLQFCKADIAARFDEADTFNDRRAIFYARNACWQLAAQVGCRYFVEFDDDYNDFSIRFKRDGTFCHISVDRQFDALADASIRFLDAAKPLTLCLAQGGDYFGGFPDTKTLLAFRRKAMNSFFCDTRRQFAFRGRVNEDVSTYTTLGRCGELMLTTMIAMLNQATTQTQSGGMTELYRDSGTYIKTFYTVIHCPSAVKVGMMGDPRADNHRIHHDIDWRYCAAKIMRADVRKPRPLPLQPAV